MPVLHFLCENLDYQMLINKITKINLIYKPHFLPDIYYTHHVLPKRLLLSLKMVHNRTDISLNNARNHGCKAYGGNGGIGPPILSLCTRWVKHQFFYSDCLR